jgi:hypothetical protein
MPQYLEFRCANKLGNDVCKGILPGPSVNTLKHAMSNGGYHALTFCSNCRHFIEIDIEGNSFPVFKILPKRSQLPLVPFDSIFPAVKVEH